MLEQFKNLTPAEAEAYRAQFAADGPARLTELASFIQADGALLDEFDGTVASLEPLWQWYVGFIHAGLPGIPEGVFPRIEAVMPQGAETARRSYVGEMLIHYLYEVAAHCFAEVSWVSNPDVGFDDYQRVAVQFWDDDGNRGLVHLDRFMGNVSGGVGERKQGYSTPTFLMERFLVGPFSCSPVTAERILAMPRGKSILAPLLASDDISHLPSQQVLARPPVHPREAVPTREVIRQQKAAAKLADAEPAGDELVLAHKHADIEALEEAVPLKPAGVSSLLTDLGFLSATDQPPTVGTILGQDHAEFYLDEDAMATTLVVDGELRAVQLASLTTTRKTWTALTTAFTKAGRPMGAKLAREDEFMPDEED